MQGNSRGNARATPSNGVRRAPSVWELSVYAERPSDAAQDAVSTVIQSIWMSSLPLVPDGQPLECEHSCCSTVVRSTFGIVVESPAYVQTGVDMSSK